MVKKKKRSTKTGTNEGHGSTMPPESNKWDISSVHRNIQSCSSFEVKEETDIKQEPVTVGELVDVPASTYQNATHVPDSNESNGEYDFDFLSLDEVKLDEEVKKECDGKKEEESKKNGNSGEEAVDNQPNQPKHAEVDFVSPGNDDNKAHNSQKRGVSANRKPSKRHKCDLCEYSTQRKGNFNQHLLKHTDEKPHGCNFCPKRFTRKETFYAHQKVHVKELLFHCSGCLQGFDVESEKNEHEIICKIRRYECHLCKESFGSNKANMINHMRMHSGDKPFNCKDCFKRFARKGALNEHIKLHAGPHSFRCSKCHKGFSQEEERNAHEENCNRRVYECYDCRKSFGFGKSNLISHMRTHSDESEFACQRCAKQFKWKRSLNNHMKTHTKTLPFKCLICSRGFLKDDKRKAHQRNCIRRHYECHLCKKFFNLCFVQLKGHMHTHSGEKPFQCELCCNTFTLKWNLKIHMKTIHNTKY